VYYGKYDEPGSSISMEHRCVALLYGWIGDWAFADAKMGGDGWLIGEADNTKNATHFC